MPTPSIKETISAHDEGEDLPRMGSERIEFFVKATGEPAHPELTFFVMDGEVWRDNYQTCESQCSVVGFYDFIMECPDIGWRLSAAPQSDGWMAIETAPAETELLGWREDCGVLLIMYTSFDRFATDQECEETEEVTLFQKDWFGTGIPGGFERLEGSERPTHYMPLPTPPKMTQTQGQSHGQ